MEKSSHDPMVDGMPLAPPSSSTPVYPSISGPIKEVEQEPSMDIDPVSNVPGPSPPTCAANESTSMWQALANQAFYNVGTGWKAGKTQAEHRQLLKDRANEARRRREDSQTPKAPSSRRKRLKSKLPHRAAALDAAVKIRGRRLGASAAKQAGRIEKFNARRVDAIAKAKETARAKALNRAINALDLNAMVKDQQLEPSKQLLMCLPYALTLLRRAIDAERAFKNLQLYYRNPAKASRFLPEYDRYEMSILEREEDYLRSIAREQGSIEAALVYQDEKIAEAEELAILREEFEAADRAELNLTSGQHRGESGVQTEPSSGRQHEPSSGRQHEPYPFIFSPEWLQKNYTPRQRNKDAATALDLEAYRRDPSTKEKLDKKRQNRLNQALDCGRADLNAMGLEKQQASLRRKYHG
ncbi:MAG: hypothetical protein LQ352_002033 [Teloschistes flavicans]|nr:MAG: hypothetical protein LQ352_002033 [Teloschistes flavicans]